jgi:hypothetical protein
MDPRCLIDGEPQGIFLQHMSDFYVRVQPDSWMKMSNLMRRTKARTIYIARDVDGDTEHKYAIELAFGVKIQLRTNLGSHFLRIIEAWPSFFRHDEIHILSFGAR